MNNLMIEDVLDVLKHTDRMGTDVDEPEGSRYIQLSETLVQEMIAACYAVVYIKSQALLRYENRRQK